MNNYKASALYTPSASNVPPLKSYREFSNEYNSGISSGGEADQAHPISPPKVSMVRLYEDAKRRKDNQAKYMMRKMLAD